MDCLLKCYGLEQLTSRNHLQIANSSDLLTNIVNEYIAMEGLMTDSIKMKIQNHLISNVQKEMNKLDLFAQMPNFNATTTFMNENFNNVEAMFKPISYMTKIVVKNLLESLAVGLQGVYNYSAESEKNERVLDF